MGEESGEFRYSSDSAQRFLSRFYKIEAIRIDLLPGYDDTNFHIVSEAKHFLLKLTPCDSQYFACIQTQVDITTFLKSSSISEIIAGVVPTTEGKEIAVDEMGWVGRVLEWVDGDLLGEMASVAESEWREVGVAIARFTEAIRSFPVSDSALISPSIIAMETAAETICSRLSFIANPEQVELLQYFLSQYRTFVAPVLALLPRQLVHNDLHEYNVLMKGGKVAAIIDFEDVTESYRLIDLATMSGATFQDGDDVLSKITPLVAGFHSVSPLHSAEVAALLGFMAIRLCIFVTFSAVQRVERPSEPYLYIGDELDWKRLRALRKLEYPAFAESLRLAINSSAS